MAGNARERFAADVTRLRDESGLSLTDVAAAAHVHRSYLSNIEHGRRWPSRAVAAALDAALGASGRLIVLWDDANSTGRSAEAVSRSADAEMTDRVSRVIDRPERVDQATVDALGDVLSATRRLEDNIGAGPVLPGVRGQLAVAEELVKGARGPVRDRLVGFIGGIHQYAGWLVSEVGDTATALRHLDTALAAGIEVDDPDVVSLALSFKGHIAWRAGNPGAVIGLSRAAARDERVYVAQAAFTAYQEARGHGMVGDPAEVGRVVGRADELAAVAVEHRADAQPSMYWYDESFWQVQHGLAWHSLRDPDRAADAAAALTAGLAQMGPEVAGSEWAAQFWVRLAEAYSDAGELDAAVHAAVTVVDTARALDSAPLRATARELHADLARANPRSDELRPLTERLAAT